MLPLLAITKLRGQWREEEGSTCVPRPASLPSLLWAAPQNAQKELCSHLQGIELLPAGATIAIYRP